MIDEISQAWGEHNSVSTRPSSKIELPSLNYQMLDEISQAWGEHNSVSTRPSSKIELPAPNPAIVSISFVISPFIIEISNF